MNEIQFALHEAKLALCHEIDERRGYLGMDDIMDVEIAAEIAGIETAIDIIIKKMQCYDG